MITAMVSGTFDCLHAGHIQFLKEARGLGNRLVVVLPRDSTVQQWKGRLPSLPLSHKIKVFQALEMVDEVRVGTGKDAILNFSPEMAIVRPNILAVTSDDENLEAKEKICRYYAAKLVVLDKTQPAGAPPLSSTQICRRNAYVPARVDFAGGWLDVPKLAERVGRPAHVVNCAIQPTVTESRSIYRPGGGVGGSAMAAALDGQDCLASELDAGLGWQDPAVILETGLCVWRSGPKPELAFKSDGRMLWNRMSLQWVGQPHATSELVDRPRDLNLIAEASKKAAMAVRHGDFSMLVEAVDMSWAAQLREGMEKPNLENSPAAFKYCGSGHGGYVLQLWDAPDDRTGLLIEPFIMERVNEQRYTTT